MAYNEFVIDVKGMAAMIQHLWHLLTGKIIYKLFALLFIAVSVPLLLYQSFVFKELYRTEEDNYLDYKQKLNNQIVVGIDENLNAIVRQSLSIYSHSGDLAVMLSQNPLDYGAEYNRAVDNIKDVSQSSLQSNNKIAAITYFTLDGAVKLNSSRYVAVANNYNSREDGWFQEVLHQNGNTVILGPHIPRHIDYRGGNERMVISLARTVIDFNTFEPCGIMVMDQNVSEFRQESFNVELETDESIAILDGDNRIVYANRVENGAFFEVLPEIQSGGEAFFSTEIAGQDVIVSTNASERYGWRVVSILPKKTLAEKSKDLRAVSRSLFWGVLLLVFGVSIVCANAFVRPLLKLKRGIQHTKEGNLQARVDIPGHDEIAQIGAAFNEMSIHLAKLIRDNYQTNLLKKQAELESLQSQINPHFLFNTLNTIKGESDAAGIRHVSKMIKSLSDLFRYSLNRGNYLVTVAEEVDIIHQYLFLQQCRFGNRVEVIYEIDACILNERIVRLSLQPICENAFQHGLELYGKRGILRIRGWREGADYYIEIANTGKLIEASELDTINALLQLDPETDREKISERVGVINVNSRIKFHFGKEYGVCFERRDGYTVVRIVLPCAVGARASDTGGG